MLIEIKDICKRFRTDEVLTTALNKVSLHINKGEFVSIMGPSGCGKSTLLTILGMLDQPDEGSYKFDGEEIAKYTEKKLAHVRNANLGFIFQSFNLIDELTIRENIELPLLYQKDISAEDKKQKVDTVMEQMSISHRANHIPSQLSGGQQQRVAIARALVSNPKLILADEPTGNLDSKHGEEVMELLKQLNEKGTSIVMVTHSPEHAKYAQRTINLLDGQVQSAANPEKVTTSQVQEAEAVV